jgi:serine/threonine-protein kinase
MQFRRHMPELKNFKFPLTLPGVSLPPIERRQVVRWALYLTGAFVLGYVVAALFIFPAPILAHRRVVPRVLGLPYAEAQSQITTAGLRVENSGAEPHPTAPAGTVVWQDPPPGVAVTGNPRVSLVTSSGPAKVPVPDVAQLDSALATSMLTAAGLTVSQVEAVQAAVPPGIAMLTRPAAGTPLAPGAGVTLVVSRGAPTIAVPDLLGLSQIDARTRLETEGLSLGSVTRRHTGDAAPGTVIGQKPAAGTLASPATLVDIIVARP